MAETLIDLLQRVDESSMNAESKDFMKKALKIVAEDKGLNALEQLVDDYTVGDVDED